MNFKSYQRKRSPQKSNLFGKVRKLMVSSFEMVFHKKSNENIIIDMTIPNKIVQDYRNGFEALCLQENLEGPA